MTARQSGLCHHPALDHPQAKSAGNDEAGRDQRRQGQQCGRRVASRHSDEPRRLPPHGRRSLLDARDRRDLAGLVDAKLAIVPREARSSPPYPLGMSLQAPQLVAPKVPAEFVVNADERLFWFTLFVPDERIDEAHVELRGLENRFSTILRFQERYRYAILNRDIVAPLVYPYAQSFTATGAWGWLADSSPDSIAKLRGFDQEFMELSASRPEYRRYVQSELASGPDTYERCFGAEIYRQLLRIKTKLDPKWLLNRGSVFAASGDGPSVRS